MGDGRAGSYAVIFVSRLAAGAEGYEAAAQRMVELVSEQPGFLGFDSVREPGGEGITVSYWRSLADIEAWRGQEEHQRAQEEGARRWYDRFEYHVARIERSRSVAREATGKGTP